LVSGKILRRRIRANLMQLRYADELRNLRYYGMFIGYPRSGHTLVASLLDAHENMLFSNGLDAAHYLAQGFSVQQVAALSIWNALRFTRHGRRSNGYSYAVPDGWHGRWDALQVVGDKSGDLFSYHLQNDAGILDPVIEGLGALGRFVHVVRNPFDCISSISRRNRISLHAAAAEFFGLCDANARARQAIPAVAWLDVYLEDLIHQPGFSIGALCRFFGQQGAEPHLSRCANLILHAPRRASSEAPWDAALVRETGDRMKAYPWFDGYRFDQAWRAAAQPVRNAAPRSPVLLRGGAGFRR
jgi:hypothetical protein